MTKIELLERIAEIAEKIIYDATSLQPDQFNPDSYEVAAAHMNTLSKALLALELEEAKETPDT